jgi:hypothetical protein
MMGFVLLAVQIVRSCITLRCVAVEQKHFGKLGRCIHNLENVTHIFDASKKWLTAKKKTSWSLMITDVL